MKRKTSLLGISPKWEVSVPLFSVMTTEHRAKRPVLLIWLRPDENPEHTWQLEGL